MPTPFHFHLSGRIRLTFLLSCFVFWFTASNLQSAESEQPLIELLASDAPKADKAITCKKLAVWGSENAVPELAKLLPDPELTSWARIALEAIPGDAADQALLEALEITEGRILIGVVNSIAFRKSTGAIEKLTDLLSNQDVGVASSAAVAIGKIGGDAAAETLLATMADSNSELKSAAAEGVILIAETTLAAGDNVEAVKLYDSVRQSDVPKQRIVEATRGAILARGADGVELLVDQLKSDDRVMLNIGLATARELTSDGTTDELVKSLDQLDPFRKGLLILAIADRGDDSVIPAMSELSKSSDVSVRVAAIAAIQSIGDVSCVDTLLDSVNAENAEVADAAKMALANLSGEDVDAAIADRVEDSDLREAVIELIGKRRIAAVPALLKAANDADASVRSAALSALGQVASINDLSVLIDRVNDPKNSADAEPALDALRAACVRMPDRDLCAEKLTTAMDNASQTTKIAFLEVLAGMGGSKALETVGDAANNGNPKLQDAASRLLGGWMTIDAAPVLLELANKADNPYRIRALRGHLRIVRQFIMPEEQRPVMAAQALAAADRDAEKQLVLDAVKRYPSIAMLKLAIEVSKTPTMEQEATQVAMVVAKQLTASEEAMTLLKELHYEPIDVKIIEATYGAGELQKDVTKAVRNAVGDIPYVALPNSSFNQSFGGDPAPGEKKLLKIKYQLDGKEGEAVFRENTSVVLPMIP
ncbi:HEAT repeat protein [Planctomycetes bacterium CA13]|uniref:HEAT repeat protein n=1 Tax=Novipirellula herctigrandis TaxID=2527986 RepID=A0A5C5ZC83_9BACT|nr:HEAT repeat protein [Planctomycetes bacterium CA13]